MFGQKDGREGENWGNSAICNCLNGTVGRAQTTNSAPIKPRRLDPCPCLPLFGTVARPSFDYGSRIGARDGLAFDGPCSGEVSHNRD